jgi:hypothetical protein
MNLGMCVVTACCRLGPNSCKTFIPASLPMVEPKSLNGADAERLQYGREAVSAAIEVTTRRR